MRRILAGVLVLVLLAWPIQASSVGNCAPFRTWVTTDALTASDLNTSMTVISTTNWTTQCLDDFSATLAEMQTTTDPYPSATESLATSLAGEIARLRYVLQNTFGLSQWYAHTENINLTHRSTAIVQGAGYGYHVTAVGLHVWSGWRTGAPQPALFPSITSAADHWTGLAFPLMGHVAVVIGDENRNGGTHGGIEAIRFHALGMVFHHAVALRFVHSTAQMDGGQRGHLTVLQLTRGLADGSGRDDLILGHLGAGLTIASAHITLAHVGGFLQLQRHFSVSMTPVPNALYADTIVKAAADFDGSNTARTVSFGFNVASVTRNSVGDYSVAFITNMLAAHYAVGLWGASTGVNPTMIGPPGNAGTTKTASGFRFQIVSEGGTLHDCLHCTFFVVGPQ